VKKECFPKTELKLLIAALTAILALMFLNLVSTLKTVKELQTCREELAFKNELVNTLTSENEALKQGIASVEALVVNHCNASKINNSWLLELK